MVLPFILGTAAISAGVTGIKKGIDSVSDNSKAKQLHEDTKLAYEITEHTLKCRRHNTTESLEKLGKLKLNVWNQQLGRFVRLYEQLKNVELTGQANVNELNNRGYSKFISNYRTCFG